MTETNPIRARVEIELDVEFDNAEAVHVAAVELVNHFEFADASEAEDERTLVASDLSAALTTVIDLPENMGGDDLLTVTGTTIGVKWISQAQETDDVEEVDGIDDVPQGSAEARLSLASIAQGSVHVRGIDWLFEDDDPRPSSPELAERMRVRTFIKGLLWHASVTIIDHLFDDVARITDNIEDARAWEDTWVLSGLPPRFGRHYGPLFARKFLIATADVTARLADGWTVPPTVAHELALKLILDEVTVTQELLGIDLPNDWREHLEQSLYQDLDFELLYSDRLDGVERYADPSLGIAPMGIESWFVPFDNGGRPAPYATDEAPDADFAGLPVDWR